MNGFFYWGQSTLADEIADDLLVGINQRKRSLFYNRGYGCGVVDYENIPLGIISSVLMKYEAARFMAIRNSVVSDGTNGPDRRTAASQDTILVDISSDGNVDLRVNYVLMADIATQKTMSAPIGGSK